MEFHSLFGRTSSDTFVSVQLFYGRRRKLFVLRRSDGDEDTICEFSTFSLVDDQDYEMDVILSFYLLPVVTTAVTLRRTVQGTLSKLDYHEATEANNYLMPTCPTPETQTTNLDQIPKDVQYRVVASFSASAVVYAKKRVVHYIWFQISMSDNTCHISKFVVDIAVSSNGFVTDVGDSIEKIYAVRETISKILIKFERSHIMVSTLLTFVFYSHASASPSVFLPHTSIIVVYGWKESVFTLRSIRSTSHGSRIFLERLRVSVVALSVSSDESTYSMSHSGIRITFLQQASSNVSFTIRTLIIPVRQNCSANLVTCRRTKSTALYIASGDYQIQLFDSVRRSGKPSWVYRRLGKCCLRST